MGKDPLLTTKEEEDKRQEDLKDFSAQPANRHVQNCSFGFLFNHCKRATRFGRTKRGTQTGGYQNKISSATTTNPILFYS